MWIPPTAGQRLATSALNTGEFMSTDGPVLDTLVDMTAASVDHNSLSPREYMLARLAALVAVDAPPISYFASASAIEESGLTTEDIQGVMIAIAPVVGGPRVMSAGGHILRALGIAIAVAEAEMIGEDSQP
jgi:alkylhydroperoxidase/carboxymuconolactone decarboxylase family protein YurZ